MKIEIHHYDQIGFTHVATVTSPDAEVWEALEYAYRWTNNIDGSWSIKERTFEGGHEKWRLQSGRGSRRPASRRCQGQDLGASIFHDGGRFHHGRQALGGCHVRL
jgi:hypothetical protein